MVSLSNALLSVVEGHERNRCFHVGYALRTIFQTPLPNPSKGTRCVPYGIIHPNHRKGHGLAVFG